MSTDRRNPFFIVSGDKSKIHKLTEVLTKNFPHASVFQASDWTEFKYKLANIHPKAIFVDEYLPMGSGLEIVSRIIKDRGNKDCHVVIMAAVADHDQFSTEVAMGRVTYLTEPDRDTAIIQSISKIISPIKPVEDPEFQIKNLRPGEYLFKEGDRTEFVYIVKRGELYAFAKDLEGGHIELGDIKSGEFVGEMGHFNHEPRSASVQAKTDVELIAIPYRSLEQVIFARPTWAKALVKTLSQRLRRANKALAG